jgi:hypothetical protein
MSLDAGQEAQAGVLSDPITERVAQHAPGWPVALPNELRQFTWERLDDAHRIAYLSGAHTQPRELIAHDVRASRQGTRPTLTVNT